MKLKISQVKTWRESINATHLIVFFILDDGSQHVATHGKTPKNAIEAANMGNGLKTTLGWPEALCHEKPLERICKNCTYYKPDYGVHCFNGLSRDGTDGHCLNKPTNARPRVLESDMCSLFEPKL